MDKDRREFLKVILIGGGVFLIGKVFDPLFSKFSTYLSAKNSSSPFQVIEDRKRLSIYDHSGEEIFQIDKES